MLVMADVSSRHPKRKRLHPQGQSILQRIHQMAEQLWRTVHGRPAVDKNIYCAQAARNRNTRLPSLFLIPLEQIHTTTRTINARGQLQTENFTSSAKKNEVCQRNSAFARYLSEHRRVCVPSLLEPTLRRGLRNLNGVRLVSALMPEKWHCFPASTLEVIRRMREVWRWRWKRLCTSRTALIS